MFEACAAQREKKKHESLRRADEAFYIRQDVVAQEAAVAQLPRPHLNSNDSEDVDDKRVEDENITKHGGRFKEYCHQYPHTYTNEQENGSLRE